MMVLKRILLLATLLTGTFIMTAKPAVNGPVLLSQPDGSLLPAIVRGDEFLRILSDLQGHALIQDSDGWYCYATYSPDGTKKSSGYPAGRQAPSHVISESSYIPFTALTLRSAGLRRPIEATRTLRRLSLREEEGPVTKKCIVLLAQFSDLEMTYTQDDFVKMVCQEGYSENGATGSVLDYFNDQLRGDIEVQFEVGPVVTLDGTKKYYGSNDGDIRDMNISKAIEEACRKSAEAGVDFSLFDGDGDGQVDNVFVLFAGRDEADGGGEDCIWSHQYNLSYTGDSFSLSGKIIDNYAVSTEFGAWYDEEYTLMYGFAGIGSFCHEYSHVVGLMDLYDADGEGSGGLADGLWVTTGIMDGANRNNRNRTPANYNAIDYDALGIGNPEELKPGNYVLEPISRNRRFLKFESGVPGEYYLFECRDNSGWDEFIGGRGLAVYHIDKSERNSGYSDYYQKDLTAEQRWMFNQINCRPDHPCARMLPSWPEARSFDEGGYYVGVPSMVFWPYGKNNSLSPVSEPPFVFWSGDACQFAITDISMSGDNVSFKVISNAGVVLPNPIIDKNDVFQDGAIIQWSSSDPEFERDGFVIWGESNAEKLDTLTISPYAKGKYAVSFNKLKPHTAYKVSLIFGANGIYGAEKTANFTTKSVYSNGYPYINLGDAARGEDGTFKSGASLPLRVNNLQNADSVRWTMAGNEISVSADGYYKITRSGVLKAEITYSNGDKDYILKNISVR